MTDTVFGFATTQGTVDLVRVDHFGTPGVCVTADAFHAELADDYSQLAARVWFRMRRTGRASGRPVRAVGVTWIEGADQEAAVLVEALAAAGLSPVVTIAPPEASAELDSACGYAPELSGTAGLALGAALAATQRDPLPGASPSPPPTPSRTPTRSRARAGAIACGLALLVALTVNPAIPTVPAQPSRPLQRPPGGAAVIVPAPAVPVNEVYDLPQEAPVAPQPPVQLIPESPPALIQEPPASAPEFVPSAPEPPQHPPPAPPPAEQAPAEMPPAEQPPAESTCVLLCGIAL